MPASLLFAGSELLTPEQLSVLGSNGLLELCALDARFHPFERSLFGSASEGFVRGLQTAEANAKVDRDEAGPGQHADAAMFDLGFAEEVHRGEVGESERVEANITDVSLEIRWSGEEGKCLRWL